jgi:hypothetical protein
MQDANNEGSYSKFRKKKIIPQYFSDMLREQKKKILVNTFTRKLKQSIVRKQAVEH